MANAKGECPVGAEELEGMCERRTGVYKRIKADFEEWCVEQQQKFRIETLDLQDELHQLRKCLSEMEQEERRATTGLRDLLHRPWMQNKQSPDSGELFAEGDRWVSEFHSIKSENDHGLRSSGHGVDKKSILEGIRKTRKKLDDLPAEYAAAQREETRRLRARLEELWQPQSQQGPSNTQKLLDNSVQGRMRPSPEAANLGAEEASSEEASAATSAAAHGQRWRPPRERQFESFSAMGTEEIAFPLRSDMLPSSDQPNTLSAPAKPQSNTVQSSTTDRRPDHSMIRSKHKLSKPASRGFVSFRDHHGRYQAERATAEWRLHSDKRNGPLRHAVPGPGTQDQNSNPTSSPTSNTRGHPEMSMLPSIPAEGVQAMKEPTSDRHLDNTETPSNFTQKAQTGAGTSTITAVHSILREALDLNPRDRMKTLFETQETRRGSQASVSDSDSELPLAKKHKAEKTILFKEVNAENKDWRHEQIYRINEFPARSNKWYIFRCKRHRMSFLNVGGAASHLTGRDHSSIRCKGDRAVEELGIRVIDCDAKKASRNNTAHELACEQGYRPDSVVRGRHRARPRASVADRTEQQSVTSGDSDWSREDLRTGLSRRKSGDAQPLVGVIEPVPGELYQAYWPSEKCWYPVTVLPWGDLREVGMVGRLDDTDLFNQKLPTCFAVVASQNGLEIAGWKEDFQEHGRRVSERKFPCLFFDGSSTVLHAEGSSSKSVARNLAWVMAKHLRSINFRHPHGHIFNESGLAEAKYFREQVAVLDNQAIRETPEDSRPLIARDSDVGSVRESPHRNHAEHLEAAGMAHDPTPRPESSNDGRVVPRDGWHVHTTDYYRQRIDEAQTQLLRGQSGSSEHHGNVFEAQPKRP